MSRTKLKLLTTGFAVAGALLLVVWLLITGALLPPLLAIVLDVIAIALYSFGMIGVAGFISDDTGFTAWDLFKLRLNSMEGWAKVSGHPMAVAGTVAGLMVIAIAVLLITEVEDSSQPTPKPPAQAIDRPQKPANPEAAAPTPTPAPRLITDRMEIQATIANNFAWPSPGTIAKTFGADPNGIDIDLPPTQNANVSASNRGVVTFAGISAGGYSVEIDHGSGISTLYSSLAQTLVATGDHVEKGTDVGVVASYGGPREFHFEVRVAGQKVDPLRYLPSTQYGLKSSVPQTLGCPGDPIVADANSSLSLVYSADALSYYSILDVKVTPTGDAANAPQLVALPKGLLRTSLDIPALAQLKPTEYLMAATFSRGTERVEVDCRLIVQPATTIPPLPVVDSDLIPPPLIIDTPVGPIPPGEDTSPPKPVASATPKKGPTVAAGTATPVKTPTTKPSGLPATSTPAIKVSTPAKH